jgi:hypothetical protein
MLQQFTFTELIVVMLLGTWLLLTISYAAFNRFTAKLIYRFNLFNWVSAYQLFTETPREYHIYYRDELQNGEMTDWYTLTLIPRYKLWHALWYPGNLIPQTILSTADNLMQRVTSAQDKEKINFSERFNYRVILHYVLRLPAPQNLKARQFKIEMTEKLPGNASSLKQFISDLHTP